MLIVCTPSEVKEFLQKNDGVSINLNGNTQATTNGNNSITVNISDKTSAKNQIVPDSDSTYFKKQDLEKTLGSLLQNIRFLLADEVISRTSNELSESSC